MQHFEEQWHIVGLTRSIEKPLLMELKLHCIQHRKPYLYHVRLKTASPCGNSRRTIGGDENEDCCKNLPTVAPTPEEILKMSMKMSVRYFRARLSNTWGLAPSQRALGVTP
ncbi:hypothetical protein EAF04_003541 [Stromatinia cepivora]|nr:hypothetical protein EAF04_003541 [Stromatinia cepivora]